MTESHLVGVGGIKLTLHPVKRLLGLQISAESKQKGGRSHWSRPIRADSVSPVLVLAVKRVKKFVCQKQKYDSGQF